MTTPVLQDADARRRAAMDLDVSFLVEAGAGTGKTTALARRLLTIVRSGRGQLDRLAAITFTEKAATELRSRLHFEIDAALAGPLSEEERQFLREARRQFDRAQISTVHAFCADLLRERPVEACVDPDFSVLDAFEAGLLSQEVWREWLAQEMDRSPEVLKRALRAGISLEHLEACRDFLLEHRDTLSLLPSLVEDRLDVFAQDFTDKVKQLITNAQACTDQSDRAWMQVTALAESLPEEQDHAAWERLLLSDLPLSARAGVKTKWRPARTLDEVRQLFSALADVHSQTRSAWTHNLTVALALWLNGYFLAYEQKKRERGCLDFIDLLVLARDLLKRDLQVRRYFQQRFRFLLVDEFQDTDPLQAEIIFFLAEREARATEWSEVKLHPGKLFLVGDPQQSIYRFRRADLQVYAEVREIILHQGIVLALTANFRTRPAAVSWINETFTREFAAVGGEQPAYCPLTETRTENTDREVIVLPVAVATEKPSREERRQAEARAVAAFLARSAGEVGVEIWGGQSMEYRDVAVLCRTHQTLETYEDAFREEGVPHRVIGGRRYAKRQEIEELRALLRAIESPSDTIALVAALRSSWFGFSDEELAVFVCERGKLDYTSTIPALESRELAERFALAFAQLREFHEQSTRLNAAALLAELYAKTHLLPLFALHVHGNLRVANLLKLIDTARFLAEQGRTTLTAFNRFLEFQGAAFLEGDAALPEEQESAVRLLTIHQAKGLEFPIVILADAAYRQRRVSRSGIVNRIEGRVDLRISGQSVTCATLGWRKAEGQEQEREAAEERRLWYVAATRVRDHLVVPVVQAVGETTKTMEHWAVTDELSSCVTFWDHERSDDESNPGKAGIFVYRLPAYTLSASPMAALPSVFFSQVEANESALRDYLTWEQSRRATIAAGGQSEALSSVTDLLMRDKQQDFSMNDSAVAQRADRFASLRFGRALHAALRSANLSNDASSPIITLSEMWRPDEKEDLKQLVAATLASPLMGRAQKAEARFAETPFSLHLSGRLIEGVIDFAFIENGAWVIVDFKTNQTPVSGVEARAATYRSQLSIYALALERLTRHPVAELTVLFVRSQQTVSWVWNDEARHMAETIIDSTPRPRKEEG